MTDIKRESISIFPRWLVVLALVVLVPLAADFNAHLVTIRQMRQEESQLAQGIAGEEARRAALEATRAYVASDAYVEHWARVKARMARPGEVAVIPVARQTPTRVPMTSSTPATRPSLSPLDEWWDIFFGSSSAAP